MTELVPYLPGFAVAVGILIMGGASPGPAVGVLMGIAFGQGRQAALITCLGIAMGSATVNLLTLTGVGVLLSQVAWAMTLIKMAGAAYLAWLAWGAFRKTLTPPEVAALAIAPRPRARLFAMGYALQVTNPKAIAFWLAIAATAPVAGAPLWIVTLFVVLAMMVSFATHAAWALALSAAPVRAAYLKARRRIEAALGCLFVFASFKLATARV